MADALDRAVAALRRGALVAYPTDTLYGLAARATDDRAVARLAAAKRRPPTLPISVAVSSTEEIEALGTFAPPARAFVRRHLPGPFTVLVDTAGAATPVVAALRASDGSLGVRIPDHPVARELARRAGPVTATSANRHGERTPTSIAALRTTFGDEVAVYLDGPPRPSGRPSELVDLRGAVPRTVARPDPGKVR